MTFNDTNNEINILDIVLILWKKKWNIALIVTVPLVLVFLFYPENDKSINKILVKTEIRPITYYEEGRYKIFNSYVESIKRAYSSNDSFRSSEKIFKKNESIKNNEITPNYVEILVDKEDMENLLIDNIDKLFLYNLFIDKLRQDQFLIDLIKKSNFIEEKNYASSNEYNEAVTNTVSQIDIYGDNRNEKSNIENQIFIQFETQDLKKWEKFLKLVGKEANREIQKNLVKMIDDYIYYLQKIRIYKIQDIDFLISIASQEYEIVDLKKAKKILLNSSEYIDRIEQVYSQSPISILNQFHAAKINYNGSDFVIEKSSSPTQVQVFIATGIFSLIFGIFFVLISNAIKNRK